MALLFSEAKFNALLSNQRPGLGQNVTWAKATLCPCRSRTSGAAEQGCPVCRGRGHFFDADVSAWTALASMKIQRQWEQYGQFEVGDLVATIPSDSPLWACGEHDRVTFADSSEPFDYVAVGGVDTLPWPAYEIDSVVWRDPSTKALIHGGIPTQAADNSLSWSSGAPPAGVQFTVSGRRRPQYWVFQDLIQDRSHSAGLRLPRRVVLRKYDLAGR
jgi:hypothetical protein